MFTGKKLIDYARLVLEIGVNLQRGQGLEISCPAERREIAHALAEQAYALGAKIVRVRWNDEVLDNINYTYADKDALCRIPKWFTDSKNELVRENFCYVAIAAENPMAFKNIPADKLAAVAKARSRALKYYTDKVMGNAIRWCVVSVPTLEWAKTVFPNDENCEAKLLDAIARTMRLDCPDPVGEWHKHIAALERRANFLNKERFEYLHFKNSVGTDLKVGLAEGHVWLSAKERAKDGVCFVANIPTEEVFTAPHRMKVEGTVKSALPLAENGHIIDNFSLTFRNGKVTDFSAETGYDHLKHLIERDKGAARLGEVALIDKNSPVARSGILYYNTLFDENASCHLALGKAYPTTIALGADATKKELAASGANDSAEHVDFMIGTPDISVCGIKKNGESIALMSDGEWII